VAVGCAEVIPIIRREMGYPLVAATRRTRSSRDQGDNYATSIMKSWQRSSLAEVEDKCVAAADIVRITPAFHWAGRFFGNVFESLIYNASTRHIAHPAETASGASTLRVATIA
jgi:hypothetical protein